MSSNNCPSLLLNNKCLKYVKRQKYLGMIICDNGKYDDDIALQRKGVYTRGNMIVRNFNKCTDEVKCKLFKTYCSNFYSCQTWRSFSAESLRRIKVAYNRVFRLLFKLDNRISMSLVFSLLNLSHFNVLHRNAITAFYKRLSTSSNVILTNIVNSMHFFNSQTYNYWRKCIYVC